MQFLPPRRRNPFDNPLVSISTHAFALVIAVVTAYFALEQYSLFPLWLGLALLMLLEGIWCYFFLRR